MLEYLERRAMEYIEEKEKSKGNTNKKNHHKKIQTFSPLMQSKALFCTVKQ